MCSVKIIFFLQISYWCFIAAVSHSVYVNSSFTTFRRVSRRIHNNGCSLPNHPVFGNYSIHQSTSKPIPGTLVPSGTVLRVNCQNNYKLEGGAIIICDDGAWSTEIGECLKTCSSIYSTPTMRVTCTDESNRVKENCTDPVEGTKARFKCADFYEDRSLDRYPFHLCFNGKWSHRTPECIPICGQQPNSKHPGFPWHVILYKIEDKGLVCGGSLINQRIVLTAAHCIADQLGKLRPKEDYIVAVGKHQHRYDHPEDTEAQFSSIYEMYVPEQYKGDIQNYFGDIAIIVTTETFILGSNVQPICVDWNFDLPWLIDPVKTKHGYVASWGFRGAYKNSSKNLLEKLKIPLITKEKCKQAVHYDFRQFVTDDKLCSDYLAQGLSPCQGDSGGNLVTKYRNRFYIIAVLSLCPQPPPSQERGCDCQEYVLCTKVSYFTDSFILEKVARFGP